MVHVGDQPQGAAQRGAPLPPDLATLLAERVRALGGRPLLTVYDERSGDRTELSYATFGNWAAKTANLLATEFDVTRGGTVAVSLGSHWAAPVTLAACWQVGAAAVVLPPEPQALPSGAQVAVVAEDLAHRLAAAGSPLLVVGTGPGARLTAPAPGGVGLDGRVIAFGEEVLAFGDDYDDPAVGGTDPAARVDDRSWSHADLLAAAAGRLRTGDRLLTTVALHRPAGLVDGLVAPLAAGASVVAVTGAEPSVLRRRAQEERATVALVDASDEAGAVALRDAGLRLLAD